MPPGGAVRYRNVLSPDGYVATPGAVAEVEVLDAGARLRERIMLGLRLAEGVDLAEAASDLALDPWTAERTRAAAALERAGRLERTGTVLRVPDRARVYTDGIAAALF